MQHGVQELPEYALSAILRNALNLGALDFAEERVSLTVLHHYESGGLVLYRFPQAGYVLVVTYCRHDGKFSLDIRYFAPAFQQ